MTTRSITPTLAPVLELLELERPRLVSTEDIAAIAEQAGVDWSPRLIVRRLRERGWLLDVGAKGVWEFAPAARAGAFGAGDRLAAIRAVLHREPEADFVVAEESAAFLLGYSSRPPSREVVAAAPDESVPPVLRKGRVVRWRSQLPPKRVDDLPVWSVETLLAAMSTRPSGYCDWSNVGEWLEAAARDTDLDKLKTELGSHSRASWARAAYLIWLGGRAQEADELLTAAPSGRGPFYLGDRDKAGRYERKFEVIDTTGIEVVSQ